MPCELNYINFDEIKLLEAHSEPIRLVYFIMFLTLIECLRTQCEKFDSLRVISRFDKV